MKIVPKTVLGCLKGGLESRNQKFATADQIFWVWEAADRIWAQLDYRLARGIGFRLKLDSVFRSVGFPIVFAGPPLALAAMSRQLLGGGGSLGPFCRLGACGWDMYRS